MFLTAVNSAIINVGVNESFLIVVFSGIHAQEWVYWII